jgi:AcrR family transcriptional regulator
MTRRYESPLRDERANQTRLALLDACEELLLEGPTEAVTLPAVARRAGVTKPTAYSHFPDNDALFAAFLHHVRDRIGMDHATLSAVVPSRLPSAVRDNYRRFEENALLLKRMMESPSYERVRLSRKVDRAGTALPAWKGVAAEELLRRRLAPIYMLVTPASWRWLRETWGLSPEDAASAAAWAIEVLAAAMNATSDERLPERPKTRPRRPTRPRSEKTT